MLLAGKKALVVGVANKRSIAWAIAQALAREGAQLAFTYQGERLKENVQELAQSLGQTCPLLPLDVTRDEEIKHVFSELEKSLGALHVLVHSVAFAPAEDLKGRTLDCSRDGFKMAQDISAYSLLALTKAAEGLLQKEGGSVVALTYLGSEKVVPGYNLMGLAKASLESSIRYAAYELGPKNIRVNGVSAGPVNTLAARGVAGFTKMLEHHRDKAAMKRNVDVDEVANAALFLASPLSSGVTGEILYVDCGYHIVG
jgi:enoyl-[acyl-carrier protein] reductase I